MNLLPLSSRTLYNATATATTPECSSSVMCLLCFKCVNEAIYTTNTTFRIAYIQSVKLKGNVSINIENFFIEAKKSCTYLVQNKVILFRRYQCFIKKTFKSRAI